MWLTLTDDDGTVLERRYIAPTDCTPKSIMEEIAHRIPLYDDPDEYRQVMNEE